MMTAAAGSGDGRRAAPAHHYGAGRFLQGGHSVACAYRTRKTSCASRTLFVLAMLAWLAVGASAVHAASRPSVVTAPVRPDTGNVAIHCGQLIDGSGAAARKDVTVVVRDGRIESSFDVEGLDADELATRSQLARR